MFPVRDNNALGYDLRNELNFSVPFSRIEFFKRFPAYSFTNCWNSAGDVRYHDNKITFCIALKIEILENL